MLGWHRWIKSFKSVLRMIKHINFTLAPAGLCEFELIVMSC